MRQGERFLLDWFELEAMPDGYRVWAPDDPDAIAEVRTLPEQCRVCMLRSGLEFCCASLDDAERKVAACQALGL
jgi:hypothetical protein